jgi:hypothetical protein
VGQRVLHIVQKRYSSDAHNRLSQQLESFRDQFAGKGAQAGNISARAREPCDDVGPDRFAARGHDHGNRSGGILGRRHRLRAAGHDQIDVETNQLGRKLGETLGAAVGRTVVEDEVLTFDVAELSQALSEGIEIGGVRCRGGRLQQTDTIDLARLLRPRRERPRRRPAEKRDELASPHSITSSASRGGFEGCWTSRSVSFQQVIAALLRGASPPQRTDARGRASSLRGSCVCLLRPLLGCPASAFTVTFGPNNTVVPRPA